MTDERHGTPPTLHGSDAPLDREIRRLLAVDPSPAFEARVRARVAAEPARSPWRAGRLWMAFGAAAATLVLVVAVSRLEPPADTSAEPAGAVAGVGDLAPASSSAAERRRAGRPVSGLSSTPTAEPDTATGPAAAGAAASGPPDAVSPTPPAARPPAPPRFTRVVFSESETAALRRLLSRARDRPVIVPVAVEARTPAVGEARAEVVIPPIAIEPRAEVVIPPIAIEPRAEVVIPPIAIEPQAEVVIPPIAIEPQAEVVIPPIAIEPQAEVVIPPIAIEPPITIEPLNVALLDTGANQ